jgi:hypothetical protein
LTVQVRGCKRGGEIFWSVEKKRDRIGGERKR